MIFEFSLRQEYTKNISRLVYLSEESHSLYENLRISLKFMQKIGFPIIGNPVLKSENKVLTLLYSVMQHQINCELYDELVKDKMIDEELHAQLMGLYEMTNILAFKYQECLDDWAILKERTKEELEIFNRNKLAIPA